MALSRPLISSLSALLFAAAPLSALGSAQGDPTASLLRLAHDSLRRRQAALQDVCSRPGISCSSTETAFSFNVSPALDKEFPAGCAAPLHDFLSSFHRPFVLLLSEGPGGAAKARALGAQFLRHGVVAPDAIFLKELPGPEESVRLTVATLPLSVPEGAEGLPPLMEPGTVLGDPGPAEGAKTAVSSPVPAPLPLSKKQWFRLIRFDPGEGTIKGPTKLALEQTAQILRIYPRQRISVEGFADLREKRAFSLAKERADAVAREFKHRGIPPERIVVNVHDPQEAAQGDWMQKVIVFFIE